MIPYCTECGIQKKVNPRSYLTHQMVMERLPSVHFITHTQRPSICRLSKACFWLVQSLALCCAPGRC